MKNFTIITRAPAALLLASIAAAALFLTLVALAPSPAHAQLPAICTEYPELPQCQEDEGDEDDDEGGPAANRGGGPSADAGAGGGELPFTGYPVSSLILLILALLAAGLVLRAYLSLRERTRGRGPTAAP